MCLAVFTGTVDPVLTVWAAETAVAESEQEVITIDSAAAFVAFCKNCTQEMYSRGKRVILVADISLAAEEFVPAAVFAGTFEGNGHVIKDVSFKQAGSNLGLFRYLEDGAVVQNLVVEGTFLPTGTRVSVGGITGVNKGLLQDCTFRGMIMAEESCGGIAGVNAAGGRIENCTNQAEIIGNRMTGGIAGSNDGEIVQCFNYGAVNTSKTGVVEDDGPDYNFTPESLKVNLQVEKVNDSGGIAGLSTGTISGCENHGAVGTLHTGYNTGGIAGRQNGLIIQCSNFGDVSGRKDVGGIVGQFEPYRLISYGQDMFDQLSDGLDHLSVMGDDLTNQIRSTTDRASDNLTQAQEIMKEVKEYSRDWKTAHREERDRFDETAGLQLDKIQDTLDSIDIDFSSRSAERAVSRIRGNMARIQELLTEDVETPEDFYLLLLEMSGCADAIVSDTEVAITDGIGGVEDGIFDLSDDLDSLRTETRALTDLIRERKDSIFQNMDQIDDELTEKMDRLYDQIDVVSDDLKDGKTSVRGETDRIDQELGSMHQTVSDGKARLDDNADKITDHKESLYDDISVDPNAAREPGSVLECKNQGRVTGDYHAGGIAGMIGFEISLDPEADIETYGDRSLNVTRYARAGVWNCRNDGEVTAEHAYAGGIAGRSLFGALIGNQNYGDSSVADGDYAGGIAGSSDAMIISNYSMAQISGNNYLGGITGLGRDLKSNYAMAAIRSTTGDGNGNAPSLCSSEFVGSIAGDVDPEGMVEDNYYVDEMLGAIDGVSRSGEAVGLPYENFIRIPQLPGEFQELNVTYIADDVVVKQISCQYGQPVPVHEIPAVPVRDGYFAAWEAIDGTAVNSNLKIGVVYQPWVTTIASSADKMPLMLAEAKFHPGAVLSAGECEFGDWQLPKHWRMIQAYEYSLSAEWSEVGSPLADPEEQSFAEPIVLRIRAAEYGKKAAVGIVTDGGITPVTARWDGDYLVFTMAEPGTFVILAPIHRTGRILAAVAVIGLAAGLGIYGYQRKKRGSR